MRLGLGLGINRGGAFPKKIDPATLSGLVAGYRFADTTVNAGLIDVWNDCSGNGRTALPVGTKSTADNGFARGGARYNVAATIPFDWRNGTVVIVYHGGRFNAAGSSICAFMDTSVVGGGVIAESGAHRFYNAESPAGTFRAQVGPNIAVYRYSATARKIWSNWFESSTTANASSTTALTAIWGWSAGTFSWGHERLGLFFFNRVLADSEIQAIARFYSVRKPNKDLIHIADSFGDGVGATTNMQNYQRIVEAATGRGIVASHGSGFGFGSFNLTSSTAAANASVAYGQSPIIMLDLGKNDLAGNVAVATLQTNYQNWCTTLRATGAKMVAFTIPPRNAGFGGGQTASGYETARNTFNSWLRTQTFYDALADPAADPDIGPQAAADNTTWYGDKIHPTNAGHARYAQIALAAINSIP